MHFLRIHSVVVDTVYRNTLAKVCLKAIHAHVHKSRQLLLVPFAGIRIGKVHDCHPRLPHIPLPYGTIRSF